MSNGVITYKNIDKSLLKSLPNPTGEAYEIKIHIPEFTFLGIREQPDFAVLYITFYPKKKIIELKSLKHYVYQLRGITVSYERLINIVYDHLMEVYEPDRLRMVMAFNPRGGISSRLTIDSDWGIRGGDEKYRDWMGTEWPAPPKTGPDVELYSGLNLT
jgi:7-cyano-7-deazaguanine reductase